MSAVLPFFTFSMTAPIEPSSSSLPPTTFNPSMLLLLPDPDCFRNTMWPMIFWPSLLTCQGCYEARRTGFRWFFSFYFIVTLGRVSRENDRGMKGDACLSHAFELGNQCDVCYLAESWKVTGNIVDWFPNSWRDWTVIAMKVIRERAVTLMVFKLIFLPATTSCAHPRILCTV